MEFRKFLSKFIEYNKNILKKLIIICILVLYFSFLVFYNIFRRSLNYSIGSSFLFGVIFGLIFTFLIIFLIDILRFFYLIKSGREV